MAIKAELHGKISSAGTNLSTSLEDLLTSNVFQLMRYLPPETVLLKVLKLSKSLSEKGKNALDVPDGVDCASYKFWPSYNGTEPDLHIDLFRKGKRVACMFLEMKYRSTKSNRQHTESLHESGNSAPANDQLHRQWLALEDYAKEKQVVNKNLIYVTQDWAFPKEEIEKSESAIWTEKGETPSSPHYIYWLSWQTIHLCLKAMLTKNDASSLSFYDREILKDIVDLLEKKSLMGFSGYKKLPTDELGRIRYYEEFFYQNTSKEITQKIQYFEGVQQ